MALDFPSNPTLNQIYTYGGRSWQWNGTAWDVYSTTNVVNYLNGLTGGVTLAAGSYIGITSSGGTITISGTGTAASAVTIYTVDGNTNATYYPVFVGGTGITSAYIDKSTTPLSYNPFLGTISLSNLSASGNVSGNIITQNITEAVIGNGIYIQTQGGPIFLQDNFGNGSLIILDTWGDIRLGDISGQLNNNIVTISDSNGTVDFGNMGLQSINYITSTTIQSPTITGIVTLNGQTFTNILSSLNGLTGAKSILAGTGISVTSSNSGITLTNTGVQTFNGLTGAVTGVTTGTANTFIALQSFTTGISASGGVTLSGNVAMASTSSHTGLASFAGGISASGGTFSSNVSFNSTTSHSGLATFTGGLSAAGGVTLSGNVSMTSTSSHTGLAGFAGGISASSGMTLNGTMNLNGQTFTNLVNSINGNTGALGYMSYLAGMTTTSPVYTYPDGVTTYNSGKQQFYWPYYYTISDSGSMVPQTNRLYFSLFNVEKPTTINTIRTIGNNTGITGNCYLSIYSADPNTGFPKTKLWGSSLLTVLSGYGKTQATSINYTVPAGYFYIAVTFSSTPTMYAYPRAQMNQIFGGADTTSGYKNYYCVADTNGHTLPSNIFASGITFAMVDFSSANYIGVRVEYAI
jgi:hypothetical protein